MLIDTAATSERLANAQLTADAWGLPPAARKIQVLSLRRLLLKEYGFLSFAETVSFFFFVHASPLFHLGASASFYIFKNIYF